MNPATLTNAVRQRRGAPANLLLCVVMLLVASAPARGQSATADPAWLGWLGEQIFRNECNSRRACLTSWNAGEDFPSLGIGHFIWYRAGQQEAFAETFPELLAFMQSRGAELPPWLATVNYEQPWPDREAFNAAAADPRMNELRDFLARHIELQTAFIVSRYDAALPRLLAAAATAEHGTLTARFHAVAGADAPYGLYALIDYIHFKGEGTHAGERYQGQGWGLLQVLQDMPAASAQPLHDFVTSARRILATRVRLAPAERDEQRWLAGWNKRLDTYLPDGTTHD